MFHWLEKHPFFFSVVVFLTIAFAGLVTLLPNFAQASRPVIGTKPYSILETAGRQVYIENSCNACHSQLVRPFKSETDRYGHYSLSGEYAYDRPFLWGSKRTGPDLMRVGNYRTTDWHENHMKDPAGVVPGSIMPAYRWMFTHIADIPTAYAEQLTNAQFFSVPYNEQVPMTREKIDGKLELVYEVVKMGNNVTDAHAIALAEAKVIAVDMKDKNVKDAVARGEIPEIVALIAYLNSLN